MPIKIFILKIFFIIPVFYKKIKSWIFSDNVFLSKDLFLFQKIFIYRKFYIFIGIKIRNKKNPRFLKNKIRKFFRKSFSSKELF